VGTDYKSIKPTDTSIFVAKRVQSLGPTTLTTWKCGGTELIAETEGRSVFEIQAKWLAMLGLTSVLSMMPGKHVVTTFVAPGGIVAHRIRHRLRGYVRQGEVVIVKPVPITDLFNVCEMLQSQALVLLGQNTTTNVFKTNNLGFTDWKFIVYLALVRHFSRNAAISVNLYHNFDPLYFAASGNNPMRGAATLMLPQALEQNLACLYEYNIGGTWFYPMLWHDDDYVQKSGMFNATGWLTASWSLLTNLVGVNEVSDAFADYTTLFERWSKCIEVIQAGCPHSNLMRSDRFNAAQTTCVIATSGQMKFVSSPRRIPENVRKHLDMMICPAYYVDWPTIGFEENGNAYAQGLQFLFQEPYSTAAEKGETTQALSILNALYQTLHSLGGSGTDYGDVVKEAYADTLKKTGRKVANHVANNPEQVGRVLGLVAQAMGI